MKDIFIRFKQSKDHLREVNSLAVVGILIALSLVLNRFAKVQLSPELQISFGFLASGAIGLLFGPVIGGIAGFITDILGFYIAPTGSFFPGFTLNAILSGMIYGSCLYRYKFTFIRVLITKAIINVFINIGLNSLWISIMTGKAVYLLMGARVVKNLILLPIEAVMLYLIGKIILKVYSRSRINRG